MTTLILYATKHGAAREIAERLAERMDGATLCDLRVGPVPTPDAFDQVILGSAVYAGRVLPEARAFAAQNQAALLGKPFGLFLAGMDSRGGEGFLAANFTPALLEGAKAKALLGGVYDPQKAAFWEKAVMWLLGKRAYESTVSEEAIAAFAERMKA